MIALILMLLLIPTLTACGSGSGKDSQAKAGKGLDEVSFSGDVGKSLKATWHKKVAQPKATKVTTVVEGSGAKIAKDDPVSTYLWVGNGTTKKAAYSGYDNGAPETIPNNGQLNKLFDKLFEGATYGSRVVAVTNPTDLFGSAQGNPQLGIGAKDSIVVVADFVEKAAVSPTPSDAKAQDAPAASLPKVVLKKGKPAGLDWTGIDKPDLTTPVQRVILEEGKGAKVKATDTVTVNYLGETYKAKTPFDESYSKTPMTQSLGGLIQGWKIGLTGVKVGSRVLLQIPPAYGYGAEGSGSGIPGNATLWFVIDVVKAKG